MLALRLFPRLSVVLLGPLIAGFSCAPSKETPTPPPAGARTVPAVSLPVLVGVTAEPGPSYDLLASDAPVARRYLKSQQSAPAGAVRFRDEALVLEFTTELSGHAVLELDVEVDRRVDGVLRLKLRDAPEELEFPLHFDPQRSTQKIALWERASAAAVHYVTIGPDFAGGEVHLRAARWNGASAPRSEVPWVQRGLVSARALFVPQDASAAVEIPAGTRRVRFAWAPSSTVEGAQLWMAANGNDGVVLHQEWNHEGREGWSEVEMSLPPQVRSLKILRSLGRGGFFLSEVRLFDRPAATSRPDLIIITADTLRADHLGCYGSQHTETPVIDALAARSTLFERMHTTVNMTNPSHGSLFTSLYAKDHGVYDNRTQLDENAITLAELLREHDYLCLASQGAKHISAAFSNLSQGFDRVAESPDWVRSGAKVNAGLREAVPLAAEEPLFLWAHYFDPHTPYHPPAPFHRKYYGDGDPSVARGEEVPAAFRAELSEPAPVLDAEYPRAQYRAEVDYLDHEIGELLKFLAARDRPRIVLFVADHGESLGDNGIYFNHGGLVPQTMRVPCLLIADHLEKPRRETRVLSTIDLLPTLCELLDVAVPSSARGESLLPLLANRSWQREVFFEHAHQFAVGRASAERYEILHRREHRNANYIDSIAADTTEVLQLDHPGAGVRQIGMPLESEALDALRRFLEDRRALESQRPILNASAIEGLQGLGYTGGGEDRRDR